MWLALVLVSALSTSTLAAPLEPTSAVAAAAMEVPEQVPAPEKSATNDHPFGASSLAHTVALATTGRAFGAVSDIWAHWESGWSGIAQIDFLLARDPESALHGFRLAYGAGAGVVREHVRAAVHAGLGLEVAPMRAVEGEDHAGGTAFLEARAQTTFGRNFVFGNVRGTYYYDLDCREGEGIGSGGDEDGEDDLPSCGRDTADFTPHIGWEAEVRIGRGKSASPAVILKGIFVGARYFAVATTSTRVEHHGLLSFGWASW